MNSLGSLLDTSKFIKLDYFIPRFLFDIDII